MMSNEQGLPMTAIVMLHWMHTWINFDAQTPLTGNMQSEVQPVRARDMSPSGAFEVPFHLETKFVGRVDIIHKIDKYLRSNTIRLRSRVFVLHGMGGMGKTQIALRYVRINQDSFECIIWIQCGSHEQLKQSFRTVANAMGLDDCGDSAAYVHLVLRVASRNTGRTLVVYDSLDDKSLIDEIGMNHMPLLRRQDGIQVLITTRDKRFLGVATEISDAAVGPLDEGDATSLLLQLSGSDVAEGSSVEVNDPSISQICRALGCMPLAIQLAASYMRTTGMPSHHYLTQLSKDPKNTLDYASGWPSQQRTVLNIWEDSLARIEGINPFAAKYFTLCSFLDTTVPHSLFQIAYECYQNSSDSTSTSTCASAWKSVRWIYETIPSTTAWNTAILQSFVYELQSLSLMRTVWRQDGQVLSTLHPLVQQAARLRLTPEKQKDFLQMATALVHLNAQEIGRRFKATPDSIAAYSHQQHLLPHAQTCMEFCKHVLSANIGLSVPQEVTVTLATFLTHECNYLDARQILKAALLRKDGNACSEIAALTALSLAHRRLRNLDEALRMQIEARKILDNLESQTELWYVKTSLRTTAGLATIHRDMGHIDEAVSIQSDVVTRTSDYFGKDSLETLHELACLARILFQKGNRPGLLEAKSIEERVLEVYRERYSDRPEILDRMRNLAITCWRLDQLQDALILEKQVLEGKERLYGTDHLQTASALQNLGTTYKELGQYEDALRSYKRALGIRDAILGPSNTITKKTATHLQETQCLFLTQQDLDPSPRQFCSSERRIDSGISMN